MSSFKVCKILVQVTSLALVAAAALAQTMDFHVPAGALKAALDAYVEQAAVQLVYRENDVKDLRTAGISGAWLPEAALQHILV